MYGHLLLDLTLQAVPLRDLIPLRAINRYARWFVDRRIFKHVTLQTVTPYADVDPVVLPVVAETGQRLPVPELTSGVGSRPFDILFDYLRKYTTALDLEFVHDSLLLWCDDGENLLPHLQYLRMKSANDGYHTDTLSVSFGAPTMGVFPSVIPYLRWNVRGPELTPGSITKLVQHIAFTFDMRGPAIFTWLPHTLKDEVWVMTHFELDAWRQGEIDYFEYFCTTRPDLHEEFMADIVGRLKARVNLTLTGLELSSTEWLEERYDAETFEDLQDSIRRELLDVWNVTHDELSHLDFKTWDAYASTLSPEQLEIESLPPGVSIILSSPTDNSTSNVGIERSLNCKLPSPRNSRPSTISIQLMSRRKVPSRHVAATYPLHMDV